MRSTLISRREGRVFAFTLAGGFAVIALVFGRGQIAVAWMAGALALSATVAGILLPERLGPLRAGWMRAGEAIGRVTTPIVLGLIYFLVVTPLGLVRRGIRRRAPRPDSFWQSRSGVEGRSRLQRQF